MDEKANYPNRSYLTVEGMLESMQKLPEWVLSVVEFVLPQVERLVEELDPSLIQNIYMAGCGDSYFAPVATRLAFEKHTTINTEPIEALDFSRYTVDNVKPNALVIGISNSGSTSRPLEAVRLSRKMGAKTIAITGNPLSPMSVSADFTIIQAKHNWKETLAVSGYLASSVTLYLLSLALGMKLGKINVDEFNKKLNLIKSSSEIIQATIDENNDIVKEFAYQQANAPFYQILGGGPSFGTALFSAAKLLEQPKANGIAIRLEEWAHQQFFITRQETPVIVIAPSGASVDRAREQMQGAKDVGAKVAVVCDKDDLETKQFADYSFPIMGKLPEEFTPLTFMTPGALFATHLCSAQGKSTIQSDQLHFDVNMRQLRKSHMREE